MLLTHCLMLGLNSQESLVFLAIKLVNLFIKEHYRHGVCFVLKGICGTMGTWPKSPQALRHRSPNFYYLFMEVMEVTVAVLDCPLMVAISDLNDVNLKEEAGSPCPVSDKRAPPHPQQ